MCTVPCETFLGKFEFTIGYRPTQVPLYKQQNNSFLVVSYFLASQLGCAVIPPDPASFAFLSIFAHAHKEDIVAFRPVWPLIPSHAVPSELSLVGIFANFFRASSNKLLLVCVRVCLRSTRLIHCELPHAHAPTPGDICIRQTIFYLPTNSAVLLYILDAFSHHKLLRMCRVCCSLPHS